MDTQSQNDGMWKAYGPVYKLPQNGVPVHWALANPKPPDSRTCTDFGSAAAAIQNLGTATIISPYTYTGRPFIINSADSTGAQAIISAWWAAHANQPTVHILTPSSVTATVDLISRSAPRIALESINSGIAIAYFNAAGIPGGRGAAWSSPLSLNILNAGLIGCNNKPSTSCPHVIGDSALFEAGACSARTSDILVTPHNSGYNFSTTDPTNVEIQAYAERDNFVAQSGGRLALCHSILSNENNIAAFYPLPASGATASARALFTSIQPGGPDHRRIQSDLLCAWNVDGRQPQSAGRSVGGDDGLEWTAGWVRLELAEPTCFASRRRCDHLRGRNRTGQHIPEASSGVKYDWRSTACTTTARSPGDAFPAPDDLKQFHLKSNISPCIRLPIACNVDHTIDVEDSNNYRLHALARELRYPHWYSSPYSAVAVCEGSGAYE